MELRDALRAGMRVVGPDHREYGTIERYDDAAAYVQGKRVPYAAIGRMDRDRLYVETPELWGLSSAGAGGAQIRDGAPAGAAHDTETDTRAGADMGGEIRIPILEEQLAFATREIDLGEIRVHKTVEESEETRTGQLNREDVEVERVRVDRRVTEPEASRQDGDWLIIPVMEEVFVVEKRLMVTEEIRIRKRLVTEDAEVRETVRRERATVEDTRVPRAPLITEPVMPGVRADSAHGAATTNDAAPSRSAPSHGDDDAAWEQLHQEIRDAGR